MRNPIHNPVAAARTNWRAVLPWLAMGALASFALWLAVDTPSATRVVREGAIAGETCYWVREGEPSMGCERLAKLLAETCAARPGLCKETVRRAVRGSPLWARAQVGRRISRGLAAAGLRGSITNPEPQRPTTRREPREPRGRSERSEAPSSPRKATRKPGGGSPAQTAPRAPQAPPTNPEPPEPPREAPAVPRVTVPDPPVTVPDPPEVPTVPLPAVPTVPGNSPLPRCEVPPVRPCIPGHAGNGD